MPLKFRWETRFKKTEIGEIPEDWEVTRIKEIGEVVSGSTPSTKRKEFWNGEIPWITPRDLANFDGRYIYSGERNISKAGLKSGSLRLLPPGTILFTSRAPIGYVAIAGTSVTTNQGFKSIIPDRKKIVPEYLYYLLIRVRGYIESLSGGSTFPEITKSTMEQVYVIYPPFSEQTRIATVLSWFDDLIENLKRQNELLEKTAMAIFKSWFIDFEPFKDGEFVYSEELDREIPKGWEVKKLLKFLQAFFQAAGNTQ